MTSGVGVGLTVHVGQNSYTEMETIRCNWKLFEMYKKAIGQKIFLRSSCFLFFLLTTILNM